MHLTKKQYETAFYKLPVVMKSIKTDSTHKLPTGLYYINHNGNKVYLKEYQKQQWLNGTLPGCIDCCSPSEVKSDNDAK